MGTRRPPTRPAPRPARTPALPLALLLLLALPLAACGRAGDEPPGTEDWVNPDPGSAGAPVTLEASALPYQGTVTEGIHYLRIVGLPFNASHFVTVTDKRADADLFVFGQGGFTDYQCASLLGGPEDDLCATLPLRDGVLHVQVYGYAGRATPFLLDVW